MSYIVLLTKFNRMSSKFFFIYCILSHLFLTSVFSQAASPMMTVSDSVEVIVDKWGVPHIYANNQKDLFFSQGYHAAKDRLFQFEIWRRQSTGTIAEILGERELKRDIGTRLFKFRKDIITEMNHYHKDGAEIISAYVDGVNAYIKEVREGKNNLPMEFKVLNLLPDFWTPEVVISRHQGLLGNIQSELDYARAVALIGEEKVKSIEWFHPKDPDISIDPSIDPALLFDDILELYNAYRRPVSFQDGDGAYGSIYNDLDDKLTDIGSNNWVVSGDLTESGFPVMANDPHRTLAVPSLRYMAHLVAPGWNVIGGGEPEIPGISIGHNENGAWGLTIFSTDAEDLYVYKTNPENPNQYWHKGQWLDFLIIKETIPVKGMSPVEVQLKYSVHGPVPYEDEENHIAYAVKCGWLEYGGSPYLASLRMDQAKNFDEFRIACNYSHIPGENMVWADRDGNIGWQAVGIAPIRRTHSGLVPVPGDGRYEWEGYLPIVERPHLVNPESGYIATANQNVTPLSYNHWDAVGFEWSDPYRGNRVKEVLGSGKIQSMADMMALQTDYLALPAVQLIPILRGLKSNNADVLWAINELESWDKQMTQNSIAATIYYAWETKLKDGLWSMSVPQEIKQYITSVSVKRVIEWILFPDDRFGADPLSGRNAFVIDALDQGLEWIRSKLGRDKTKWQYGQNNMKHSKLTHALSAITPDSIDQRLNVGPVPRGGYGLTVGSTGNGLVQRSGATFRVVIDTGDWDKSAAINSPGQSGDPDSKHYKDLFDDWAKDKYFPLFYSKEKVESVQDYQYFLTPQK